jgi:hypothetical protein
VVTLADIRAEAAGEAEPVDKYVTHKMLVEALNAKDVKPATSITPADIGLSNIVNYPVVTLADIRAEAAGEAEPVDKYVTHKMLVEALKAMEIVKGRDADYVLSHYLGKYDKKYTANFTVLTDGITDGTVLYWTITTLGLGAIVFSSIGGRIGIKSNRVEFSTTFTTDSRTSDEALFVCQLHTDTPLGPVVASSGIINTVDNIYVAVSLTDIIAQLHDESVYHQPIVMTAASYYWTGNLGRRIERIGSSAWA